MVARVTSPSMPFRVAWEVAGCRRQHDHGGQTEARAAGKVGSAHQRLGIRHAPLECGSGPELQEALAAGIDPIPPLAVIPAAVAAEARGT
jgi:hypothetical protein